MRRGGVMTALAVVGLACALATAPPARSQTTSCAIRVGLGTPTAGAVVEIVGDGFPSEPASIGITLDGAAVGTATIDAAGHFAAVVGIPANTTPGVHTLSAPCSV